MSRTFYDSVTASRIPRDAVGVMGYDDGLYKWSAADWGLFPNAVHVHIAVFASTNSGQVLDVERYDASPDQAPGWVTMRRNAGVDPSVYMNMSTWPAVRSAFQAQDIAEPHYWVAQYDNVQQIPSGAVAKQYYNNNALGYDMSVVEDFWPGVDTPPHPPQNNYPAWPGYWIFYTGQPPKFDQNTKTWQQRMKDRGWNIKVDGFYGSQSETVCRQFQQDSTAHGWYLHVDGILGQDTWKATWLRPIS